MKVLTAHAEVLEEAVTKGAICVELHWRRAVHVNCEAQAAVSLTKSDSGIE